MTTTWTIAVDWERSGTFDGTYDDISSDVIEARWFLGMQRPYLNTGDDSLLKLKLRNDDRHFSPEYASSPLAGYLQPFRPIRIQSDDGTTVRTHWIGWIESIAPSVNQYGERITEITAAGPMKMLKAVETTLPLQEQIRTDELLSLLVLEAVIPPAITNVWVVGRARLGEETVLGQESDLMDFQEGLITMTMAADNWVRDGGGTNSERKNYSVYRAMQDVTEAERGRFFFRRDGKAVFWNRDHLMLARTPVASFSDVMTDLKYEYAGTEHFQNEIVVGCHPRSISATSNEVLWGLESQLTIPENGSKQLTAKYEDESGGRVGGRNTSVEASFSSGSGTVSIDERANQAILTITNTGSGEAVLSTCTIKGQKILDLGRMEAMAQDLVKAAEYGRRVLQIDVAALSDLEEAQAIADFELERRKDPRGTVGSVILKSHGKNGGGQHAQQLARTVGDLIAISETQTDHSEAYYIVGEEHRLTNSATLLETTWYLEPTNIMWLAHYDKRNQDVEVALKGADGNSRLAQSFEPVDSQSMQSVRLWLKRVGLPTGNLTVTIREDDIIDDGWELGTMGKGELGTNTKLNSDGAFPGDIITSGTSDVVAAADLDEGFGWIEFTFSTPPSLTQGTVYWLVLEMADPDLVSWWELEEASGTRADSHRANNLTDNNTVTQAVGIQFNAAQFTRDNSEYLSITDAAQSGLDITDEITIAKPIYLNSLPSVAGEDFGIVNKYDSAGQKAYRLYVRSSDDVVVFSVSDDGSTDRIIAATTFGGLSVDTWYLVYARYDGSHLKLSVGDSSGLTHETDVAYSDGIFAGSSDFKIGT